MSVEIFLIQPPPCVSVTRDGGVFQIQNFTRSKGSASEGTPNNLKIAVK